MTLGISLGGKEFSKDALGHSNVSTEPLFPNKNRRVTPVRVAHTTELNSIRRRRTAACFNTVLQFYERFASNAPDKVVRVLYPYAKIPYSAIGRLIRQNAQLYVKVSYYRIYSSACYLFINLFTMKAR